MLDCLLIGAGGFAGTILRYLVGLIPVGAQEGFPIKTFLINVTGAFVIGILAALAAKNEINPHLSLMLRVGVCGGFTTFSTFAYETTSLMRGGKFGLAALYAVLSVSAGVLAVLLATVLAR